MEKRLARGLDALLGGREGKPKSESVAPPRPGGPGETRVEEIPIDAIRANADQPRSSFDETQLEELKESIRRHGLMQPIVVRQVGDRFELIAGERRWRASKALGKTTIPALVRSAEAEDRLVLALIENLQRAELNAIEEARAFVRLVQEFRLTHDEIAERVGKERSTVSNALRLLDLPDDVLDLVSRGTLSAGHARALLPLSRSPRLPAIVLEVVRDQLSVRAVEQKVKALLGGGDRRSKGKSGKAVTPPAAPGSAVLRDLETRLRGHWAVWVEIENTPTGGRISFDCRSRAEFDDLLRRLEAASWPRDHRAAIADFELDG
jgi:ParB family chromosome partitioning protein